MEQEKPYKDIGGKTRDMGNTGLTPSSIDKTNFFFSQTHFKQGYFIILLLPYRLKNTSIPDTEDALI